MEDIQIIALIEGYEAGTLSESDEAAFFSWYNQASLEEFHRIFLQCRLPQHQHPDTNAMPEDFRVRLEQSIQDYQEQEQGILTLFRRYRLGWAAAVILLVGTAGYIFYHRQSPAPETIASQPSTPPGDVAPGTTKAVLTLADGSQILLDSTHTGQLAVQGKTTVQNDHGAISYNNIQHQHASDLLYNTLTTGRGEQSPTLTLSDGTKVWLNALSSIRFPVVFTGNTRNVEITGEAFFEIAQNASQPFYVTTREMTVQVLGTQFNINAYTGEPDIRTTLLEGSVKIVSDQSALVLRPGQQARVQNGSNGTSLPNGANPQNMITLVKAPDIDQALAWKRGLFDFDHANLQTVLRQLARWYDIEVKFEGNVPIRSFHGKITRDLNLSQVIQLLQDVDVKFRIEGKTLIVTQ